MVTHVQLPMIVFFSTPVNTCDVSSLTEVFVCNLNTPSAVSSHNMEHNLSILNPDLDSYQALSPAESLAETGSSISDDNFVHGFFAALSVIIVSELGDKTFFIAAILSMKHPRLTVYAGNIFLTFV